MGPSEEPLWPTKAGRSVRHPEDFLFRMGWRLTGQVQQTAAQQQARERPAGHLWEIGNMLASKGLEFLRCFIRYFSSLVVFLEGFRQPCDALCTCCQLVWVVMNPSESVCISRNASLDWPVRWPISAPASLSRRQKPRSKQTVHDRSGGLGFPAGSEWWRIGPPTSGHFHGKNWVRVLKLCDLELV